jgi:hypothetical protein
MWIRLENDEISLILSAIPKGALTEKLQATPAPEARAFIDAVATSDELEVDEDTVVSRGDEGAFVMSWTWISNEMAGLALDQDEEEEDEDDIDFKI